MMRSHWTRTILLLGPIVLLATACGAPGEEGSDASTAEDAAGVDMAVDTAGADGVPGTAGVGVAPDTAGVDATAPDAATRAALPTLFSIMLGLQQDMERLSRGLWVEDYDGIAAAARSIADHPEIPPQEAQAISRVLGEDMAGFGALDTRVHDLSVELAEAARARDLEEVMATEAELRQGCVECHDRFRDRLRTGIGGSEGGGR